MPMRRMTVIHRRPRGGMVLAAGVVLCVHFSAHAPETVRMTAPENPAQEASPVDQGVKLVALTFDDGPHPKCLERTLALLQRHDVAATFFLVGAMAERYPEAVRTIVGDYRFRVANHTYSHANLAEADETTIRDELHRSDQVLSRLAGPGYIRFLRPPGGRVSHRAERLAAQARLQLCMWTVQVNDFLRPPARVIAERILRGCTGPREIVLLHSGVLETLEALEQVIPVLRERGYRFTTVERIMDEPDPRS